ncbi:SDR family oxidoreductase [Vibrio chagasii]|nr:SDR family oxidoreductase [Vibrio chagasii]
MKRVLVTLLMRLCHFNPKRLSNIRSRITSNTQFNKATFFITQAVASWMIKNGGGNVVNVGSMWGCAKLAVLTPILCVYSMAKAGLLLNTAYGDGACRPQHSSECGVPAVVKTPIYESFIKPEEVDQALEGFNAFHPIGRVGQPKDIANSISSCCLTVPIG